MCKLGDIIVIKEFKNEEGVTVPSHSFVVTNDEEDFVQGLRYDFVANMLCSFHDEKHKAKKLKYEENLEIKEQSIKGDNLNEKNGYIKADQLYYYRKDLIEYHVIAHLDAELLDELVQLILLLNKKGSLKNIITNLESTEV